jgi:hypothetical protein
VNKSVEEGRLAETEFVLLRDDKFVRFATREEDIMEHWDVLDSELGKVDVKAPKRKYRGGDTDHHIWWELRTVKRPPNGETSKGWGVPNGIDRLIAIRHIDAYYLLKPEDIIDDLRLRCKDYHREDFGLHTRPGRGDLMTTLPFEYVRDNARYRLNVHSGVLARQDGRD